MPTYDFKCQHCELVFEENVPIGTDMIKCPRCFLEKGKRGFWTNKAPHGTVKGNEAWKQKGKNKLDGGVPFGEVPGDEDYNWIKEGERNWGPIP